MSADLGVRILEASLLARQLLKKQHERTCASPRHPSTRKRAAVRKFYLFETAKPPIKLRKLKITQARRYREGRRPQSIGAKPLAHLEIPAVDTAVWLREMNASRPRIWRDCKPLHCPWCNAETRMMMVPAESDQHQDGFACPHCNRLVAFIEAADGTPRWERRRAGQPLARNLAAYYRAQNHAGACPWTACRHHPYLDVNEDGMIKVNFPGEAKSMDGLGENVDQLRVTCTLAEGQRLEDTKDAMTLEEIGQVLNITQERTNQIFRTGEEQVKYALSELEDA